MTNTTNKFYPEVRDLAVRPVLQTEGQHASHWQAAMSIAADADIPRDMAEGSKLLPSIDPRTMAGGLELENRELRQAEEIQRKASAYFAMAGLDWRSK